VTDMTDAEVNAVDFAVVAYRDEGDWSVAELPARALDDVETIDEDFVLVVRVSGAQVQVLLSDATAATDWTLARSAVDHLGVHVGVDDDQAPAGDLGIVADMGFAAADMGALLDDFDLYPEEVLSEIARGIGFGDKFDEIVDLSD
jgi:putative tRNA adenosine deaminase-associated protein